MDIEKRLAEAQAENRRWAEQASVLFAHQNRGIELEKGGDTQEAIDSYVRAIEYGRFADKMTPNQYFYSIERLCVIYRRLKQYRDEISIIETALEEYTNPKDRERLELRLAKAKALLAKTEKR